MYVEQRVHFEKIPYWHLNALFIDLEKGFDSMAQHLSLTTKSTDLVIYPAPGISIYTYKHTK